MKYYIPAIICGISIFWLSVTSAADLPETFKDLFSFDKIAHAFAYGVFTALILGAIYKSKGEISSPERYLVAAASTLYGVLMELIQYYFFPNRYFEVLDILANIMGIVIVHLIFNLLLNKTTEA